MKANKVTIVIKGEMLSIDTLGGLLTRLNEQVRSEATSGKLVMDDGDEIEWTTTTKPVEF